MTPLPRAECPECYREVAVRRGGELREHRDADGNLCASSGLTVAAAERAVAAAVEEFRREVQRDAEAAA